LKKQCLNVYEKKKERSSTNHSATAQHLGLQTKSGPEKINYRFSRRQSIIDFPDGNSGKSVISVEANTNFNRRLGFLRTIPIGTFQATQSPRGIT
jgi:hypothetical protein